jgi:hypothetical protein
MMDGKTKAGRPGPRAGRDLLGQAQDLIYDAWEYADPMKRATMARKALKISGDCADAYVLLAEAAAPAKALELYRKGVEAGERALGKQAFGEEAGHFWGILETRPYMRARDRELAALLKEHEHDGRAFMIWTRALFAFRTDGDSPKSRRALAQALESNPHVPAYLLGHKPIPRELPDYTGLGDESEAMCWAAENIKAWQTTNGALAWLAERINSERPPLLN